MRRSMLFDVGRGLCMHSTVTVNCRLGPATKNPPATNYHPPPPARYAYKGLQGLQGPL